MAPLLIYVLVALVLRGLSVGVYVNRYYATRKCHMCGAQVELGRSKCQVCTYRFVN